MKRLGHANGRYPSRTLTGRRWTASPAPARPPVRTQLSWAGGLLLTLLANAFLIGLFILIVAYGTGLVR